MWSWGWIERRAMGDAMELVMATTHEESLPAYASATTIDDLPTELLAVILTDESYLAPRWRFCARAVCQRWRALFDAAGREMRRAASPAEERRLDALCRWDPAARPRALVKWRRGVYVCASAVVQWARQGRWDDDPAGLVTWCASIPGSSLRYAAGVLVATARSPLVRHAVESVVDACAYVHKSPSSWGSCCLSRCPSRADLARRLFVMAVDTGDIPTVTLVAAALHPSLDWVTGFAVDLVAGDHPDAVEWTARRVAAEWSQTPTRAVAWLDHFCKKLWTWSAYGGSWQVVARLVALARSPAGADSTHDSSGLSHAHDPSEPSLSLEASLDRARRLYFKECVSDAVLEGHVAVLGALASHMDASRLVRVCGQAVRAWRVPVAEWALAECRARGVRLDMDDIMARALNPYHTVNERPFTHQHEVLLSWLCDPSGGGYDPACEAVPSLLGKAVGGGAVRCLFWAVQHWSAKLASLGAAPVEAAVGLLVRHGCRQSLDPTSDAHAADAPTLERLVHVLDALAAHGRAVTCDLWPVLVGLARCRPRGLAAVQHAWARVTGAPLDDVDRARCMREPCGLASARSWARWCRVAPVAPPSADDAAGRVREDPKATRALVDWLGRHDLLTGCA